MTENIVRLLTDAHLRNRVQRAIRVRMGSDLDISSWVTDDVMDIVAPALEEVRREAAADRTRILAVVSEWVTTAAEFGGVDHGDLVDDLAAAGYTLPTDDEETDR